MKKKALAALLSASMVMATLADAEALPLKHLRNRRQQIRERSPKRLLRQPERRQRKARQLIRLRQIPRQKGKRHPL